MQQKNTKDTVNQELYPKKRLAGRRYDERIQQQSIYRVNARQVRFYFRSEVKTMEQQKLYGYARVSTRNQNEDRQVIALREMGLNDKQIFVDKQSGKDFNRPQYKKLLRKLDNNFVLFFKSIDRLGRNYDDLIE